MSNVCIMTPDSDSGRFRILKALDLSRVPVLGEKIFIPEHTERGTTTWIYEVVDVHFTDNERTDVCAVCIGEQEDYLKTLASTHRSK